MRELNERRHCRSWAGSMHTGERQQTSKNVEKSYAKVNRKPTKWRSGGSGETSLKHMDSPRFTSKEKCGFHPLPDRKPTPHETTNWSPEHRKCTGRWIGKAHMWRNRKEHEYSIVLNAQKLAKTSVRAHFSHMHPDVTKCQKSVQIQAFTIRNPQNLEYFIEQI